MSHLVIFVDTSGSIDRIAFSAFCAEVSEVMQEAERTTVIYSDTKPCAVEEYGMGETLPANVEGKGGGGTAFVETFQLIADEYGDADCCLVFTDLDCNRIGEEPPMPVLWAAYGAAIEIARLAPRYTFGEILHINE
jgi:predicted metal-dependent peptidase